MFGAYDDNHRPGKPPTQHLPARRPSALARFARQPRLAEGGPRAARRRHQRPLFELSGLRDRRRGRAGPRGARRPAGAAAPDPVVLDAAAAEALARRGPRATAGPTAAAARRWRARTAGWSRPPAGRNTATTRRATTATSSTPSCRPTSRPPRCAACASCRRCCSTARAARRTEALMAHVEVFKDGSRLPGLARAGGPARAARSCVVPATDRPHEREEA